MNPVIPDYRFRYNPSASLFAFDSLQTLSLLPAALRDDCLGRRPFSAPITTIVTLSLCSQVSERSSPEEPYIARKRETTVLFGYGVEVSHLHFALATCISSLFSRVLASIW
jgi:hypothetical protein